MPKPSIDGLVKSPIYFVVGFKRQFAVPHVLPNHRLKHYASYIDLFPESIYESNKSFYKSTKYYPKGKRMMRVPRF